MTGCLHLWNIISCLGSERLSSLRRWNWCCQPLMFLWLWSSSFHHYTLSFPRTPSFWPLIQWIASSFFFFVIFVVTWKWITTSMTLLMLRINPCLTLQRHNINKTRVPSKSKYTTKSATKSGQTHTHTTVIPGLPVSLCSSAMVSVYS